MSDLKKSKPHWFNEDGSLKPYDQRRQEQAAVDRAERRVAIQVAAMAPPPKPTSGFESRIAELKDKLRHATPDERAAIRERLRILEPAHEKWQAEQSEAARIARLSANESVRLAREHALAFGRTPPPGAEPHAVRLAVATATSNDWDDPAELSKAYWSQVSEIEAKAAAPEQSKLLERQAEQARSEADVARQHIAVAERKHAAEQARLNLEAQ